MSRAGGAFATDALLLRAIPYRDNDRIVTLLTLERGKLSALARGARSSRKRFGGVLEPFVRFRARLTAGAGELYTLHEVEAQQAYSGILADLGRLEIAGCGLRLVRELSPVEHPDPGLYSETLRLLAFCEHASEVPRRATLTAFTVRALGALGSTPRFEACGSCGRAAPAGRAGTFDPTLGALVCRACGGAAYPLSAEARGWLGQAVGDWVEAARSPLRGPALDAATAAVRAFLAVHGSPALADALFASEP